MPGPIRTFVAPRVEEIKERLIRISQKPPEDHLLGVLREDGFQIYSGEGATIPKGARHHEHKRHEFFKHHKDSPIVKAIEEAERETGIKIGDKGVEIGIRLNMEGEEGFAELNRRVIEFFKTSNGVSPILPFLALLQDTHEPPLYPIPEHGYEDLIELRDACRKFKLIKFTCPSNPALADKINEKLDPQFQTTGLISLLAATTYNPDQDPATMLAAPAMGVAVGLLFGAWAENTEFQNAVITTLARTGILFAGDASENFLNNQGSTIDETRRGANLLAAEGRNAAQSIEGAGDAIPIEAIGLAITALPIPFAYQIGGLLVSTGTSGGLEVRSIDLHKDYDQAYLELLQSNRIPHMMRALAKTRHDRVRRLRGITDDYSDKDEAHDLGERELITVSSQRMANRAVGWSSVIGVTLPLMFWASSETLAMFGEGVVQAGRQISRHTWKDHLFREWLDHEHTQRDILQMSDQMRFALMMQGYSEAWGRFNRLISGPIIKVGGAVARFVGRKHTVDELRNMLSDEHKRIVRNASQAVINEVGNSEDAYNRALHKAVAIAEQLGDKNFCHDFLQQISLKAYKASRDPSTFKKATGEMETILDDFNRRYGGFATADYIGIKTNALAIVEMMRACANPPKKAKGDSGVDPRAHAIMMLASALNILKNPPEKTPQSEVKYKALLYSIDALNENYPDVRIDEAVRKELEKYLSHPLAPDKHPGHVPTMTVFEEIARLKEMIGILRTERMEERVFKGTSGMITLNPSNGEEIKDTPKPPEFLGQHVHFGRSHAQVQRA